MDRGTSIEMFRSNRTEGGLRHVIFRAGRLLEEMETESEAEERMDREADNDAWSDAT